MNVRSGFLVVVLGILAALTAVSCGGPSEPVIGVLIPETGRGAAYGASVKAGIDLAVEEVNAAGGIEGQPLRVIYGDTATDPATGVAAARKLIEENGVPAIIGAVNSSVTLTVLEQVTEPFKVVLLSPSSSSPKLTGRSSYFNRVYPSDSLEGARMAEMTSEELRLRKLVVFAVADEYGKGYKKTFVDRYRRYKNREVLKTFNFMPGDLDFAAMAEETKALEPDGIFVIAYMDAVAAVALALREAGVTLPILSSGSLTARFPGLAGEAGEGILFSRPSFRHIGDPEKSAAFIQAYTAKYGDEPQDYAAYSYDALKLMAQVLNQGNRTSEKIQLAMRAPDARYEGITGVIVFGNEGDVVASPTAYIIKDGAVLLYKDYLEQGGLPPGTDPEEE
jgi:branched-chain amino acid transport system substrate-binding protein